MSYVKFENVCKKYDNSKTLSVENFDLDVEQGEFIVFVGPSGCGKSTTLRMLAGLEEITDGKISIEEKVINDIHPKDRDIAMVFQNYALYPHMSVYDNIAFGLKIRKVPKKEIDKKVNWAAEILGLKEYLKRKPKDLSGGQRQRVALGRAIVRNPKVFLMDEPLSNLDAKLRVSMRNEITKLHKELKATTIYVTHDQIEAMTMADRIVVLNNGKIQQVGKPMELYNNPANLFVASFIGTPQMNFFDCKVVNQEIVIENKYSFELPGGVIKKLSDNINSDICIGVRPEHLQTSKLVLDNNIKLIITNDILSMEKMGSDDYLFTKLNSKQLVLKVPSTLNLDVGDKVDFVIDFNKVYYFDKKTGKKLF